MLARLVVLLAVLVACEGPVGPQGERGERGLSGVDGKDGKDGRDGVDGEDGRDGRDGEDGVDGEDGRDGVDLWVQIAEGTVLERNYTEGNPSHISIPLSNSEREPTVLSFRIESTSGVYIMEPDFPVIALVRYGEDSSSSISGYGGWWYAMVYDRRQDLLGSNYRIKFVQ